MNKNYLILGMAMLSGVAFGQKRMDGIPKLSAAHKLDADGVVFSEPKNPGMTNRAPGTVVFQETFSNGLAGDNGLTTPTWTTAGPDGALWLPDTDGPNGDFSNPATQKINSTTSANGFVIFDSNFSNNGCVASGTCADRVGSLVSPVIDASSYTTTGLVLSFEQAYRHCCDNAFEYYLEVSSDGFASEIIQIVVSDRGSLPFFNSVNDFTGTITTKVNLASVVSTLATPTNMQFRFKHDGTGGTSHYFWQIDDVTLIEPYANDLAILSRGYYANTPLGYGLGYPITPVQQIAPINFYSGIENMGGTQSNVTLGVAVSGAGTYSGSSSPVTINAGATNDSLNVGQFIPSAAGTYTFTYTATGNTDDDANDNTLTRTFVVSADVLARDEAGTNSAAPVTGGFIDNVTSNVGLAFEIGNVFEVVTTDTITHIELGLASSTFNPTANIVGKTIIGKVYVFDGVGDYIQIGETDVHSIVSGDLGKILRLPLIPSVSSDPFAVVNSGDDILVTAGHYGGNANGQDDVAFSTAGYVEEGTVLGYAGGSLFQLLSPEAPVVRPILANNVSVSENELSFALGQNVPNPANGVTAITYALSKAGEVSFEVVDLAGKVVYSAEEGARGVGNYTISFDTKNLSAGVYYYSLIVDGNKITKKMVITR